MKSKNKILAICAVLIVIAAVLLIVKPWAAAKPAVTQPTVEPVVTESPTEAPTEEPTQEPTEVPTVAPATAVPETTDAPAAADLTADTRYWRRWATTRSCFPMCRKSPVCCIIMAIPKRKTIISTR